MCSPGLCLPVHPLKPLKYPDFWSRHRAAPTWEYEGIHRDALSGSRGAGQHIPFGERQGHGAMSDIKLFRVSSGQAMNSPARPTNWRPM